ncbi:MAG: hypothetical protein QOE35_3049 [Actinomycetota bacterium]|jgi:hypothetical protein
MPLQPDGPAPYAPAATVIGVIEGYRDRGFATPFTADVLIRAGVTVTLAPRTLQSLKQLDLLDPDGTPTEQFELLRRARGEEEFKERVQAWLRSVYSEILQYADPATDPPTRVAEAFRGYQPAGQRNRMVTLMWGLFEYAGIAAPPKERPTSPVRKASPRAVKAAAKATAKGRSYGGGYAQAASAQADNDGLPAGLVGLLRQIPRKGGWTRDTRDNFLRAFTAVLDFSVPLASAEFIDDSDEFEAYNEESPL